MNPERVVEIKLWDWLLSRSKSVRNVYFNSKNEVGARTFSVGGESITKPDLLVEFVNPFTNCVEWMAIEVKDASKSGNVRGGTKIFEEYLLNVVEKRSGYFVGDREIFVGHFAIATQFSEQGHLQKKETLDWNVSVQGNFSVGNKIVPFYEFVKSKEMHRGMLASYAKYRKDNGAGKDKLPSLGILISDVLLNFEKDELEKNVGACGMPIYQAITFNSNKNRWSQCLMKI